ncbi:MAG: twitching motility protein PilT [Deltaproteobacteria bacterium]|nr:twitching motility protein PilT [Deltaproteobacteria bacterium]
MAPEAVFRFYEELNDFLPAGRRKVDVVVTVDGGASVSDAIGALGVPLDAVDLVLVDGQSVDLSHPVLPGVRVSIYPVFESLDVSALARIPGRPLRRPQFLVAASCRDLARALEVRGFDSRVAKAGEEERAARVAVEEGRILLTTDGPTAEDPSLPRVLRLQGATVEAQVDEVLDRLDLRGPAPTRRATRP